MSGIRRHFLGWDEPLGRKVCHFLFSDGIPSTPDLDSQLIVVPTRQAGRRLREAVALHCAESNRKSPVLGLRVAPPTFFLLAPSPEPEASPSLVKTVWADVVLAADFSGLSGLFPTDTPHRDGAWAFRLGETIQSLRDSLAEGGYSIAGALAQHGEQIEEPDRWQDLARLEAAYLEALGRLGKEDPCSRRIRLSDAPEAPDGVSRIVVAAVPDPTLLLTRALERLAGKLDVDILVYAPAALKDDFDLWGRPVPAQWQAALIPVPAPDANILLAASPADQSRRAVQTIAAGIGSTASGPSDIGIGVPDPAVVPYLQADLAERGIRTFDPAGKPVMSGPLGTLLALLRDVCADETYSTFAAFVRHPDVLEYLQHSSGFRSLDVLRELDDYQQACLPTGWRQGAGLAKLAPPKRPASGNGFPSPDGPAERGVRFAAISAVIDRLLAAFSNLAFPAALRGLLSNLYGHRTVLASRSEDVEFAETAAILDGVLHEIETTLESSGDSTIADAFDLFLRRLESERYEPDKPPDAVDLEGWLELPWNDAPLLIVTGMNEGFVPDSRLSDMFLPDRLRRELGLRDDQVRFARDIYLANSLLEWRRAEGRVVFVAGRAGAEGDPLKPSRLLFRCPDSELVVRARALFAEPQERRETVPLEIRLKLDPAPPPDLAPGRLPVAALSVTAFRAYLQCPFRFYLRHVLQMEALDPGKSAMDELDFGILVHAALRAMAEDEALRACRDADVLAAFLRDQAARAARRQYGARLPLLIQLQVEAAQQRLAAAARVQAQLAADGWAIVHPEIKYEVGIGGLKVRGTVDRIDRHAGTGRLRVLDYKTTDKAAAPHETHWRAAREDTRDYARIEAGGRAKAWQDLQLPLYRLMVLAQPEFAGQPCEIGYFNLPKAAGDTGVDVWDPFTEDLAVAAERCAAGVIGDVRANRFWPPAEKVRNDEFEVLFPAGAEECFDTTASFGRAAR